MSSNEERRPYQVRISPRDGDGKYMFWIMSPNNRTLAKSTNNYRTRGAAEHAARGLVKALASNGIEVI